MNKETIKSWANEVEDQLVAYRRQFHSHPELSFQEKETTAYICSKLDEFNIPYVINPGGLGCVAELKGEKPGKTVAFRADIDALQMPEDPSCPFASQNEGVMHACGHDAHAAIMLGFAKVMSEHRDAIEGTIKFIFQHAEEMLPGGAKAILDSGILDDVDAFYGLHTSSSEDTGVITVRAGEFMAEPDKFEIVLKGKGGHSSAPHTTIDPVLLAGHVIVDMQAIVSRMLSPLDPAVISICQVNAGSAFNVIADYATLTGTVRSLKPEVKDRIKEKMEAVLKGVTAMYGGSYELRYIEGYPMTINNPDAAKLVKDAVEELGDIEVQEASVSMGAEDFSYYLMKNRGCYFNLGCRYPGTETIPHHNPKFYVDEKCLPIGVQAFLAIYFKEISR